MKIDEIEKSLYTGYIWYSNKTIPDVLLNEEFPLDGLNSQNAFIVEGQLCNDKISISIKFVDGEYIICKYDLSNYEKTAAIEFVPNRMSDKGVEKLMFKRVWEAEKDPLCCDMDVLQPKELVFVGFKMKEDKK